MGDSFAGVFDPATGKMLSGTPRTHQDDQPGAVPSAPVEGLFVTKLHGFDSVDEQKRYTAGLKATPVQPRFIVRNDVILPKIADRQVCNLAKAGEKAGTWMVCVEPSRTLEMDAPVEPLDGEEDVPEGVTEAVLALQRPPEYCVWQLPAQRPLAIFVSCDGFDSNKAVPSYEKLASLMSSPGEAICSASWLQGTIIGELLQSGGRLPKPSSTPLAAVQALWSAISEAYNDSSLLDYVLDDRWYRVIGKSNKFLQKYLSQNTHCTTLLDDSDQALAVAAHLAILCLSEDNISAEVLLLV